MSTEYRMLSEDDRDIESITSYRFKNLDFVPAREQMALLILRHADKFPDGFTMRVLEDGGIEIAKLEAE